MTGFREDLEALRWSPAVFADAVDVREGEVRRWVNGTRYPPRSLALWLADLAEYVRDHPPPERPPERVYKGTNDLRPWQEDQS